MGVLGGNSLRNHAKYQTDKDRIALMARNWTPDSWTRFEAKHLPVYEDTAELADAEATLAAYPPLVFAGEARALKADLAEVAEGRAFLLQPGDLFGGDFRRSGSLV